MALLRSANRKIPSNMEIQLTDVENQICVLVDECCADLKATKGIDTSCRIAGGWVRDKLLGMQSNDIDIALTDIMGEDFAHHFVAFANSKGLKTGEPTIINPNPEQSKHLQTARINNVYGLELDLVNLRSEEYADNSRIPTSVAFGTPVQDALRRDITINALFYNIHTRSVEDWTEKGLDDLKSGTIRTPLPPRETFLDDPLRVLRCLRFASRFGFEIVPELAEAVQDPLIQSALVTKVTRERVGEEVSKMMKGPDPLRAIQLIDHLSLYDAIFSAHPSNVTASLSGPVASSSSSVKAVYVLRSLLNPSDSALEGVPLVHPTLLSAVHDDPTAPARLYLAASLIPHLGLTYLEKKKKTHAVESAIRYSLKLGAQNHYIDGIPLLFAAAELLRNPDLNQEKFKIPSERVALGLLLRDRAIHHPSSGARWQLSALFSLVIELGPLYDPTTDKLDVIEATKIIELYNTFVKRVEELELANVGDAKPILDGREVGTILGVAKPGAWTGHVLSKVLEWQLQNPKGTKDGCSAWLKGEQTSGGINVDEGTTSEPASKRARTKR